MSKMSKMKTRPQEEEYHVPGCTGVNRCASSGITKESVPADCEDGREIFLLDGTGLLKVSDLDSNFFLDSLVVEAAVNGDMLPAVLLLAMDTLLSFSSPLSSSSFFLPSLASNKRSKLEVSIS